MAKDGFAGYDPKSNYGDRWDEIFKKKDNVVVLDDHRPHSVTEAICSCGKSWIATHPTSCDKLKCPYCKDGWYSIGGNYE